MREIKFRAWDINKKIFTAVLIDSRDGKNLYSCNRELNEEKNIILMQYTGLLDKNGKEIYEGDIAMIFGTLAEVRFSDTWCGFVFFDSSRSVELQELPFHDGIGGNYKISEIIGNIYANPDLLSKPQQ